MKTTRKLKVKPVRRAASLSLSARIDRLEKAVLPPRLEKAGAPMPAQRFVNLDANGQPTSGDWIATYDRKTDLVHLAAPVQNGKEMGQIEGVKACTELDILGLRGWRAYTIEELLSIIDYERYDPAVDTAHFKGPYGWTWTSTIARAPSGVAWGVSLGGGSSGRDLRSGRSYVRAVCASQQFGLRF